MQHHNFWCNTRILKQACMLFTPITEVWVLTPFWERFSWSVMQSCAFQVGSQNACEKLRAKAFTVKPTHNSTYKINVKAKRYNRHTDFYRQRKIKEKANLQNLHVRIERIRKGQFLDLYKVRNGGDFHVPALRCIYNIMKTCSEQSSWRDFYALLSCSEQLWQIYDFELKIVRGQNARFGF